MGRYLVLFLLPLSAFQLTIFVDARDLDYRSVKTLWHSLHHQETPTFGHAWIRLEGIRNGESYVLEGGHTGEFGHLQPRYLEGVIHYNQTGDPNPIRYLWETQKDGCFQTGSGGHTPTHIAIIPIDEETFNRILTFIEEGHYPFGHYNLTRHQCTTFIVQVAALAGITLSHSITLPVEPKIRRLHLWNDPAYSELVLSAPDVLIQNPQFKLIF